MKHYMTFPILLVALVLSGCAQEAIEQKTIDPNYIEDGGFEFTFGVPEGFKVTAADRGANIYYEPNPTVVRYNLYHGETDEMQGIEQAIENGFENPLDVGDANNIRIMNGSLTPGQDYFFAVEAFNSEGESSGLTSTKSITIRDFEGVEVGYQVELRACISGDNKALFRFEEGRMYLDHMDDADQDRLPGHGGDKCIYDGVSLTLRKLVDNQPSGPYYFLPPGTNGKKVFDSVGEYIQIFNEESSNPDFFNMITDEPMTVSMDGDIRKVCQGGLFNKYRVKARDAFGPVEDDDPIDTIEIHTKNCASGNWTSFTNSKDNVIKFNLFFQVEQFIDGED